MLKESSEEEKKDPERKISLYQMVIDTIEEEDEQHESRNTSIVNRSNNATKTASQNISLSNQTNQ